MKIITCNGQPGKRASFPIYFDKIYYTEGVQRMKVHSSGHFACRRNTGIHWFYVDEDQLDSLYLDTRI